MKKNYILGLALFVVMLAANSSQAQNRFFSYKPESSFVTANQNRVIVPDKYKTIQIDMPTALAFLATLPKQENVTDKNQTPIMELPMPDGSFAKFHVWERSIMEPGLEAQVPTFKTYVGQGITDKSAVLVMDMTDAFHAMVMSNVTGNYYIDAYDLNTDKNYISYFRRDLKPRYPLIEDGQIIDHNTASTIPTTGERFPTGQCRSNKLRKYRLAVGCSNQYAKAATAKAAPTKAQALAKITTTVNRVTGVYELEAGITFTLVTSELNIVFVATTGDPFNGVNSNPSALIDSSQNVITRIIGSANFDIGHTFSTGGGGLAGLGVVCNDAQKASGITGLNPTPTGDAYDIDYVAHEMGHQHSGNHTFNSQLGSCSGNGNRTPAGAATNCEPGSGTTIMAYAGICTSDNIGGIHLNPGAVGLQGWSDPQFHAASLSEIYKYTVTGTGSTCGTVTTVTNSAPVVTVGSNYTIPVNTPFILTGSATDADAGNALSYSWEQIDVAGAFGAWDATPQVVNIPLFRSFAPMTTGVRYFPQIDDVVSGSTTTGERLPSIARTMKFRLTVRDNNAGCGGTCYADETLTVNATGGAFSVTYPTNAGEVWYETQTKTVTWAKGSTNLSPFSVTTVTIELSTDGGYTFPITLLASTLNSGSASITVPTGHITTQARIRVRALNNVFYNMSTNDFEIKANPVPVKWLSFTGEKVKNSAVKLNWDVNEIDNHFYTIERSIDGDNFSKIGEVAASTASGNNHSYSFVDARPFATKNYYRIKQVDKDGRYSYSNVITINIDEATSNWVVYPNPTTENINLFCNANYNNMQVQIFDAVGKLVYSETKAKALKGEIITVSLQRLTKGVYSIKLQASNAETTTKKIIVQ